MAAAGTFFSDGLRIIFAFLTNEDWRHARVWLVAKQWRAAATTAQSRGLEFDSTKSQQLANLITSPLRHHVTGVLVEGKTGSDWMRIHQLTWITKLTIDTDTRMDYAPLLQLRQLQHLVTIEVELSAQQLQCIKQLASLVTLSQRSARRRAPRGYLHPWSVQSLATLCTPPHQLQQLEDIGLVATHLTREMCTALLQLPALTSIDPRSLALEFLPLLDRWPRLTSTQIRGPIGHEVLDPRVLLDRVSALAWSRLEHLDLWRIDLPSDGPALMFAQVMASCTSMTHLGLTWCSMTAQSFAALAAAPKLRSLSTSHIVYPSEADRPSAAVLQACTHLRALETSQDQYTFLEQDVASIRRALPQLTECTVVDQQWSP